MSIPLTWKDYQKSHDFGNAVGLSALGWICVAFIGSLLSTADTTLGSGDTGAILTAAFIFLVATLSAGLVFAHAILLSRRHASRQRPSLVKSNVMLMTGLIALPAGLAGTFLSWRTAMDEPESQGPFLLAVFALSAVLLFFGWPLQVTGLIGRATIIGGPVAFNLSDPETTPASVPSVQDGE